MKLIKFALIGVIQCANFNKKISFLHLTILFLLLLLYLFNENFLGSSIYVKQELKPVSP